MRTAVILGAIVLAAAVPQAVAQPNDATSTPAAASPVGRFMGALRDSINLPPSLRGEPESKPAPRTFRSRRAYRPKSRQRARAMRRAPTPRAAQQVPWPRPVAASRQSAPASNITVLRTSVVRRPIVRTVLVANELLPLPAAEFVGDPVRLHVPTIGEVEIPEDRYPQVFTLLVSENPAHQSEALRILRQIRETTEALRDWARNKSRLRDTNQGLR